MIKVIICDDQDIVREGLCTILTSDTGIQVLKTVSNGQELMEVLEEQAKSENGGSLPDLILMDLKMPVMNGIQATRRIHSSFPAIKVLVLTTYDDDEWIIDALRAGASGYLLKDTPKSGLTDAVKGTVLGNTYVDPSIAGRLLAFITDASQLPKNRVENDYSDRERSILKLIAKGYSNAEIGSELFLSTGTVRNYSSTIFVKLGVSDRTQAAIAALRLGVIRIEEV
ncbi:MAG: response regulator transcription factor [Spirochaetia bacterium]|nr:response regulator transcription factor [Spirochaetia bacterium]